MRRRAAALALISMHLLSIGAWAAPRLVMPTDEWSPFRIKTADSESSFTGIDLELTALLSEELGFELEVQRHPWGRALEMLRNGQADLMTGVAYTAERAEFLEYVPTPYAVAQPVFFVRKGLAASVSRYEDLSGKVIGQSTSSFYFEPYNSDASLIKKDLATEEQIVKLLALGRIDVAIGTDPNISWDVARFGLRDQVERAVYVPPYKTELYIVLSKRSRYLYLADDVDAVIRRLLAAGRIDAIRERYR